MSLPTRKSRASRASRALRLGLVISPMVFALSGCSKVSTLGYPEGVTSVNDITLPLWQGAWIAGGVVGVITLVLILWPAVFHRAKASKGEFPRQTQYNVPVEIVYTVIPFIIIAVMFYFTAVKQNEITEKSPNVDREITVNGIQWSWQFGYPEAGEKIVVTGTPEKPPTLVVPVGERVRYIITSSDVVHAFWVPAFMNQIQNLPGVTNQIEFTANKIGEYPGFCNILCGRSHTYMRFTMKVVSTADYERYLETLKASAA